MHVLMDGGVLAGHIGNSGVTAEASVLPVDSSAALFTVGAVVRLSEAVINGLFA